MNRAQRRLLKRAKGDPDRAWDLARSKPGIGRNKGDAINRIRQADAIANARLENVERIEVVDDAD